MSPLDFSKKYEMKFDELVKASILDAMKTDPVGVYAISTVYGLGFSESAAAKCRLPICSMDSSHLERLTIQ